MFKKKVLGLLMAAGFVTFSNGASAQITKYYDFGVLVGAFPVQYATSAPNNFIYNPFAHLQVDDFGTYTNFTLSINNNLFSSFGPAAYLRTIYFDYVPNTGWVHPVTVLGSNLANMTAGIVATDTLYGVTFDFGTAFGLDLTNPNYLTSNTWVKWQVGGVGSPSQLVNSDVQVVNITLPSGGNYVAKYALLPVPEPEAYAMLLAGLGLFGVTLRKRKTDTA